MERKPPSNNRIPELQAPFRYKGNLLAVEGLPVESIAARVSTPVYIYSSAGILERLRAYQRAFRSVPHLICYAVKANSNLAILRLLARHNAGADIVSGGELRRALLAGFPPGKIIFSGVGKTEEEIKDALRARIRMINVESEEELRLIRKTARKLKVQAPISIRVNPDIAADTHHHIQTGSKTNKFGIDAAQTIRLYRETARARELRIMGIQCHIGSQITQMRPYGKALEILLSLRERLLKEGIPIEVVDIGGGLGASYHEGPSPHPEKLARMILPKFRENDAILFLEPGRSLVAESGILVTRVIYRKNSHGKHFIIVDAAMNDLARPALYDAFHLIQPVRKSPTGRWVTADVVGPICESGDILGKARRLRTPRQNDCLAVMTAGAYGFSMSSQYNSRPRAAEALVEDGKWRLIRKRETQKDLLRGEIELI
jgi:diaminopimelate decarboxylase